MKKVLFVLEASLGGTGKHVLDVIEGIDRALYEPVLVCSLVRADTVFLERIRTIKINTQVIFLPMRRRPCFFVDVFHLIQLYVIMKRIRFDIVHTHSAKAGFLGRVAAKIAGVQTIFYTPHAFSFFATPYRLVKYLYIFLEQCVGKITTTLIVVSEEERRIAIHYRLVSSKQIELIHNGIDVSLYGIQSRRDEVRRGFGINKGDIVFSFIGRIGAQKDIKTLFRAIDTLVDGPARNLRFLCIGIHTKEIEPMVKKFSRLRDRILFLGVRNDVPVLLSASDVFISCARYEGFAYAPLEAMASRLPVILTEEGNNGAILDKKEGLLFKAGDDAELSRIIVSLAKDPVSRLRFGLAGRARVENNFSVRGMLGQLMELYKREL